MSSTKLTLSIDKQVIDRAKKYARENGQSLSALIENYLRLLGGRKKAATPKLSKKISALKGIAPLPDDKDWKQVVEEAMAEKYGK